MSDLSLREKIFVGFASLACAALYWPALGGSPLWDDQSFWFYSQEMKVSYLGILENFTWPIAFTVQKFMLDIFGENYFAYHYVNLCLHLLNSSLLFWTAKRLNWPKPSWIFLLFLLHPANVAAVAWMIQIKTLLCFLFAILAFAAFERGLEDRKFMIGAFLLLGLSILSKSASVTLPILFLIYAYPRVSSRKFLLWFAPLFLAGILGASIVISRNRNFDTFAVRAENRLEFIAMTSRYYITKSVFPLENSPIKGRSPLHAGYFDLTVLGVLIALVFFIRKTTNIVYLIGGIVLLLPFLGLILAPYMAVTWVSDQHLYLALPLLLAFWISLLTKLPQKVQHALLVSFLVLYSFKTFQTAHFYQNEDQFYSESLHTDPGSTTAAFNYANSLAYADRIDEALAVTDRIHELAEKDKSIALNSRFGEIENLRQRLLAFKKIKDKK
ncbi:MAG: ArnT family glycosyltransferase [Pseudobdellovibrionaceae bacterium]